MANFPKPSEIENQYFRILKSIKPSLNINDPNSDFVIRGKAFAGLVSGVYGDQAKVNNDTYIASARPEALDLKGEDAGIPRNPATRAQSPAVEVKGTEEGITIPAGQLLRYPPTGVEYEVVTGVAIAGGRAVVQVRATQEGSIGNVRAPDTLELVNPPAKVSVKATLLESLADGSDAEDDDAYRLRLQIRQQEPPSGGNETDYLETAKKADPSIRSAFVRRFGRGLGTVDVYITSGTTDIDTAVTRGLSVVRVPSSIVLEKVQRYFETHVPLTDCPGIYAPTEIGIDVALGVTLAAGLTLDSIPASPTYNPKDLTIRQLIEREVGRVLYNLPVGGRVFPGSPQGYVVASEIEENLDEWLSARVDNATRLPEGRIPVLLDRQVTALGGSAVNRPIARNEIVAPNVITIGIGV